MWSRFVTLSNPVKSKALWELDKNSILWWHVYAISVFVLFLFLFLFCPEKTGEDDKMKAKRWETQPAKPRPKISSFRFSPRCYRLLGSQFCNLHFRFFVFLPRSKSASFRLLGAKRRNCRNKPPYNADWGCIIMLVNLLILQYIE